MSSLQPGTSKWYKIEPPLFFQITARHPAEDLRDHRPSHREHPDGRRAVKVTKEQMDAIALVRDVVHGEWNYKLLPR